LETTTTRYIGEGPSTKCPWNCGIRGEYSLTIPFFISPSSTLPGAIPDLHALARQPFEQIPLRFRQMTFERGHALFQLDPPRVPAAADGG
jgi:hypothetical protein